MKKHCPQCNKMVDSRGMWRHMAKHNGPAFAKLTLSPMERYDKLLGEVHLGRLTSF